MAESLIRAMKDATRAALAIQEMAEWLSERPLRCWLIKVISGGRIVIEKVKVADD